MSTIFALASARGKAGVAVIRLSGPESWSTVDRLCGGLPRPRHASLRQIRHQGEVLDEGLVLTFAEGASFTGEQAAELHLHGSVATVAAVLRVLGDMAGLRQADAGEFTRRALENGRLDLTQVEGLADLIDAETEAQRRQALRVMTGAIGRRAEQWRVDLIHAAALIEATIDFADEDVPVDVTPDAMRLLSGVQDALKAEERGAAAAERVRDGFEVAIVGRPNAGKSTLLNALVGREAALTSVHAGTTRDVIEVRMDLGGLAVTILDTAGLREAIDPVEALGVSRALQRAEAADLRVFLTDGGALPYLEPKAGDLIVSGKADLLPAEHGLSVSGVTGAGIDELLAALTKELSARTAGSGVIVRERQRVAVARAIAHLGLALDRLSGGDGAEIVADDIRRAIAALDSLVGRVDVEDLLDVIFASFCIGK